MARQIQTQLKHAWDLEKSFDWSRSIDTQLPLVPLDEQAILFPGAGQEERLAISQAMGLIIAACICEMEESLLRLRHECWDEVHARLPVNPEFRQLGDLFFEEERKHSTAFRRYMEKFAHALGIELQDLERILPRIERTKSEFLLRRNIRGGGLSFWWIVAIVEQEFLNLHRCIHPFREKLEPFYVEIHRKHFEEEARHASFPYLVLELLAERGGRRPMNFLHVKGDLAFAQVLQTCWAVDSLRKVKNVRDLQHKHPFFGALARVLPLLEGQHPARIIWKLLKSAPYVSSLVNLTSHRIVQRHADRLGALKVPFPAHEPVKLVI